MHPSIVRRVGIPAILAGAFLMLVACNQAVEPTPTDDIMGSPAPSGIGSAGPSGGSRSSTNDLLLGSWRQAGADGKKYNDSLVLAFAAAGTYVVTQTPPGKVSAEFWDEKGNYTISGDTLTLAPTSIRVSYNGKDWTEESMAPYSFTFSVSTVSLILTMGGNDYHFVR